MTTFAPILTQPSVPGVRSTPLPVVLAFTALNALGSGLVTSGLYFAASSRYGFGLAENYALGLLVGVTYTFGALGSSRVVDRSRGRSRAVLAGILAVLALATQWPVLLGGSSAAPWLVVLCYCPSVAMLWPIVQSHVTGGRRGTALRSAVGQFNFTWGVALAFGFAVIGPSLERTPELLLSALGGLHLATLLLLFAFVRAPAEARSAPLATPEARDLEMRRVMQRLLPLTNVLAFALAPFLPEAFAALGLPSASRATCAVAWLLPRAIVFGLLARWHGWHGRYATAAVGAGTLIGGFAFAMLAPWIDRGTLGLALELIGLAAFGVGMATVYTAALYYAQCVGGSAVGAGGRHEALLGAGATVGPLFGLSVAVLVEADLLPTGSLEPVLVGACVLLAAGFVVRALRR